MFVLSSVCPSGRYFETSEPMLTPTGTSGLRQRLWNDELWWSACQRSRSHETEVWFRGLAEAPFPNTTTGFK